MIRNACDSHFHVMGPPDVYPARAGHAYVLEVSPIERYLESVRRLGFSRHVIVQPSIYGVDNRCMIDAMRNQPPGSIRGVAVIDAGFDDRTLASMDAVGVRAVRFNLVHGERAGRDEILAMARRVASFGWHLELYMTGEVLPELADLLRELPTRFVIDHMGHIVAGDASEAEAMRCLFTLLEGGQAFVKLIGYRSSRQESPYADTAPLTTALAAGFPNRCLWGSDWPNLNVPSPPTPERLFRIFQSAVPSTDAQAQILVENPRLLYGFE